jgi:DNA-binding NtrC family response regulator
VRELRNVIHRAVVLCLGDQITIGDLPQGLTGGSAAGAVALSSDRAAVPPAGNGALEALAEKEDLDYRERVRLFEIWLIERALNASGGNQTTAAKQLGLPVRTLSHKIRTFGISIDK